MASHAQVIAARNAAAMAGSVELVANELGVDGAAIGAFLLANPVPYLRACRVAVPSSLDAVELLAFHPGHFDHEDLERVATAAGVPPERVPPLGAVALGHEVRGLYAGLALARAAAPALPLVVDARWGPWGLADALGLLGASERARTAAREALEPLPGAAGHLLGLTVGADGAARVDAMRVVHYDAPGDTPAVAAALGRLVARLGLPRAHADWLEDRLPRLRPGPSSHDVLVSVTLDDAAGLAPSVALDFVALPTLVALDALDGLGFDVALGGALSTIESVLSVPHDDEGRRWLDGLRVVLGEGARPRVEFAWFVEPERFQSLTATLN
ncbi:MAG: hypothetical protein H6745_24615 [Deltaproteobacteria bacterium]|nr:hypothetical protein [Deltaproteobacteria bacterium]